MGELLNTRAIFFGWGGIEGFKGIKVGAGWGGGLLRRTSSLPFFLLLPPGPKGPHLLLFRSRLLRGGKLK